MEIDRKIEKYYYLTGDEKSKVGNADPVNDVHWDFFENRDFNFELTDPLIFKINGGKSSGTVGDYQLNSCGFNVFSDKLRLIIEKYLTDIDKPKWFPAMISDMENNYYNYSILYFFNKADFLDKEKSTFVPGTDHPIKMRYDLAKIGDRLIYKPYKYGINLCVHDIVRREIKKAALEGLYFYKIHTPGRLS